MIDTDLAARIDEFVHALQAQGDLKNPTWRQGLGRVLRHEFVPAAAWAVPDHPGRRPYPIDRARDEAAWLDAIYSDACIITQIDDGDGDPATGKGRWTSALTAPGAAVRLLELLDPQSGDRVMEVGTGTGWTAGMLAWRCGPASVVTIEVDPGRAAQARVNLAHLDIQPRVIVGDSAEGARAWGPYDGVHATCAVNHIPMAWVQQTRPGGTIVAPYQPGFGIGVGLKLTVADADYAVGRFHGGAGGQMMRAHRYAVAADMAEFRHHRDDAETCTTRMDPRTIANASPGAHLVISALVPGVRSYLTPAAPQIPGEQTLWLVQTRPDATTDGSWALVTYQPGRHGYHVEQCGPRRLWDEVRNAYGRWVGWGLPELDRLGMSVAPGVQSVWLDQPPMKISRPIEELTG